MNVAILGAGSIIPDFMEAAARVPELQMYAIYGRESSREKLERMQQQYQIRRIYYDYEALLEDEAVEVVYVALPNDLHYPFAKKALEHKKHVIMEKPFADSVSQAQELTTLARQQQVMILEAITNQYLPNYEKTRNLLGELGDIKIVEINFSQYSSRYQRFKKGDVAPAFDPKHSGGALMDLNIYNIHFAVGMFGSPSGVHYYGNQERGVDTSGILVLTYPGFSCVCIGAKDCDAPSTVNIQGNAGCLHSDSKTNSYETFVLQLRQQEPRLFALNQDMPRLYHELRAFTDMILQKDFAGYEKRCRHTLLVQQVLDEARASSFD
jgi:predicted dehydrogenase